MNQWEPFPSRVAAPLPSSAKTESRAAALLGRRRFRCEESVFEQT